MYGAKPFENSGALDPSSPAKALHFEETATPRSQLVNTKSLLRVWCFCGGVVSPGLPMTESEGFCGFLGSDGGQ